MTEETLFELLLRTPEAERPALLDQACEDNPELRARMEALLQADADSSPLSKQPMAIDATTGFEATQNYTSSDPTPGFIIASRYILVERIGEGGMGDVWVAKQSEPVKRRVALKLIKAGMDSKSVLQRFEQERQALALMDHPNIAKVLDGGLTQDRRPYFVMELVNGAPLTKFCDDAKLGIRERLEIFIPICQAVQHAHQKGIVHRDLKPSNILVTIIDGKPIPKVIDFGVAKATSGRLTEVSLSTQFGAVVGTLEYMSPEQAGFSGEDIDTRADIYSLGVILYELLTGLRPIDAKRLKKAAFTEMIRIIKEEEPSKPSTRLSTDDSAPSMAALRLTEPKKLSTLLRGELDWVVMKCLEKQRDRRYETANGLARDIQRYLADEVVEAKPPSAGYRLKKFVSRNMGKVIAAGLILLTLLGGIIGTSWGFWQAERQRLLAVEAQIKEREMAEGERLAKDKAERRLKQIEKSNEILGSVFKSLEPKEIAEAQKPLQALLVDHLIKAADELEGEAIGDPVVTADIQVKVGNSLHALGAYSQALSLLEKARKTFENKLGNDDVKTVSCINDLAQVYVSLGKPLLAIPLFEKILKLTKDRLGPEHLDTITYQSNMACALDDAGKHEQAIQLYQEALKNCKLMRGSDDPLTLSIMNNLAGVYTKTDTLQLAMPLYEETLKLRKSKLGLKHPDTLKSLNNLASVYWESGQLDKSIPLMEEVLQNKISFLGREHPSTLLTIANLGVNLKDAGRFREALPLLEEVYRARETYPKLKGFCKALFECYISMKLAEPAKALLKDVVADARNQLTENSTELGDALSEISLPLLQIKVYTEAEPLLRECLTIREKTQPDAWNTFNAKSMLGEALMGQKKYSEAEAQLLKGYEGMQVREKTIPKQANTRLPEALDRLIHLYTETNKLDDVKKWQAERNRFSDTPRKK